MLDLLRQYRRDLHQIPELDFDLPKTTRYIRDALSKYDCRILTPSPSAICAWFDFGKKETIAFRADMDGLPIAERTSKPYASRHTGKMHACGHDGHMSMILALAERIESHREALSRNVMLIFSPPRRQKAERSPSWKAASSQPAMWSASLAATYGRNCPQEPSGRAAGR